VSSATSVSSNVSHSQLQSSTFYYGITIGATTLNISTHCITTLRIMSLFLTLRAGAVWPSVIFFIVILSVIMLASVTMMNAVMLSVMAPDGVCCGILSYLLLDFLDTGQD
jgi:hypothetical protein